MKVLLVGTGGVGEAIALLAQDRPWLEKMVLADLNPRRLREVKRKLRSSRKFPIAILDAGDRRQVAALARRHRVDWVVNAVEPRFNKQIFDAAYQARCNYLDMAMTLSTPHPEEPFRQCGVKLGDYQFARARRWERKGLLALVGMGVEPGLADVFARYAEKHLFDEIDEIGVRDGADLQVRGYAFAPTFSIWTTIEECLNPPVIWEADRGWFTTEPFSGAEVFDFPEGIGPVECVNVEHEEVLLVPRWVRCRRVTFKYGLGDEFIGVLKTIHMLGLDNKNPIRVGRVKVAPRDVVAACLPDPASLGDRMSGRTCAGTWVKGRKDGKPRQVYLYQVADNETCMRKYGVQAVVWQTAVNPVIALELVAEGMWKGSGVLGPEAFDPDPFLARMPDFEFPFGMREMV
jgi:saccharopine dehydrogenase-like NADP-dependent oxidoreductase